MQQQRGQRKSAQDDISMSFLVHAILRQRLSTPGNTCLSDHWRDLVWGWPNFHTPSLSVVNLDEVNLLCLGHHPKMFLFLPEEMAYMYTRIGAEDIDGLQVMAYEVLAMAEMRYHLRKRSTNPRDMTWGDAMSHVVLGDLARLERLMWAIFDGVLAAGASPELGPNESWGAGGAWHFQQTFICQEKPLQPVPHDYHGCEGHAGTQRMGRSAHNAQPPPGLRAHPEYQQGAPSTLCKINDFGGTPRTSGVPKEAGCGGLFRMG